MAVDAALRLGERRPEVRRWLLWPIATLGIASTALACALVIRFGMRSMVLGWNSAPGSGGSGTRLWGGFLNAMFRVIGDLPTLPVTLSLGACVIAWILVGQRRLRVSDRFTIAAAIVALAVLALAAMDAASLDRGSRTSIAHRAHEWSWIWQSGRNPADVDALPLTEGARVGALAAYLTYDSMACAAPAGAILLLSAALLRRWGWGLPVRPWWRWLVAVAVALPILRLLEWAPHVLYGRAMADPVWKSAHPTLIQVVTKVGGMNWISNRVRVVVVFAGFAAAGLILVMLWRHLSRRTGSVSPVSRRAFRWWLAAQIATMTMLTVVFMPLGLGSTEWRYVQFRWGESSLDFLVVAPLLMPIVAGLAHRSLPLLMWMLVVLACGIAASFIPW